MTNGIYKADSPKIGQSGSTQKGTTNNTQYKNTQDTVLYQYQQEKPRDKNLVFDDPNLIHGFTQTPNIVLRDSRLTDADKVLYGLLLSYAWHNGECFPGRDTLINDMGCDKKKFDRTMKHLKELNLIRVERRGLGKTNIYHIRRLSDSYSRAFYDRG